MIRDKLYRAIAKSVSGRFLIFLTQFLMLAIYARIFTPYEFGILASIQVFVIFFTLIADVGIGPAIINEEKFSPNQRDGIFTFTIILGTLISIAFFFLSYGVNEYYQDYEYQDIALVISIGILFNTINIVPITALNKDTKFILLSGTEAILEFLAFFFVYFLYSNGFGIISLATRTPIISIGKFFAIWLFSKNTTIGQPYISKNIHHIKKILSFSLYQFGFNLINYFSRNLDNLLIGKYLGISTLGIYEKAYQLMRYPLLLTTFSMSPAIQPVLNKVRTDVDKVVFEHNLLTSRLLAISLLISTFLNFNANSIVLIIFGSQWIDVVPLIKIFSIMIPVQAVLSTSGSFFQVMNQPKLLFLSGALAGVINVFSIVFGVWFGDVKVIAWGLVFSFSINFFQAYYVLFKYVFSVDITPFYKKLLSSICLVLPPIFSYSLIKITMDFYFDFYYLADFMLNFLAAILILVVFRFRLYRAFISDN